MAERTASPGGSSVASGSTTNKVQQVGSRQGTRSRSRTTRKPSVSAGATSSMGHPLPRYSSEDHPLSAANLAAKGYHSFTCLGVPFHVPKRYIFIRELGIGAYGCVALARDEELDMNVAIKKVTRVFERDVLARRALREVAILRHMLKNQNCTALIDFDTTFIDFSEIYLFLSASEADLSQIIRSGQPLSDAHLQYFAAQLLRGVRYMHAANIIHRDLKPGNLLVNADCALFICDFGLARAFTDDATGAHWRSRSETRAQRARNVASNEPPTVDEGSSSAHLVSPGSSKHLVRTDLSSADRKAAPESPRATTPKPSKIRTTRLAFPGGPLTEYVSTRWYRAPEIMLGFTEGYGPEIDMWSVGCILAELASGKPLFDGKDYVDQIARIHGVLGPPSPSVLDRISSERAKVYVESLPKDSPPLPLRKILQEAEPGLIDLLQQLLVWDPQKRLAAEDALRHPWLSAYHGVVDKWEKPEPFNKFDEIELIDSLSEFRGALQTEADEVKGEYASLFGIGNDDHLSSSCSATDDSGDDSGSNPRAASSTTAASGKAPRDITSLSQAPTQDLSGEASSKGGAKGEGMESHKSISSSASSTSSLTGSGSNLATIPRLGESSSEGYTTDTCSPLTSVGESASLSSSSDHFHFSSGPARPAGFLGNVAQQRSFTMTTVKSEGDVGGRGKQSGTSEVVPLKVTRRPAPLRTTSAYASSSSKAVQENGAARDALHATPRYRRRAISNAPRPVLLEAGDTDLVLGPRLFSSISLRGGSLELASRRANEIVSLDLRSPPDETGKEGVENVGRARRRLRSSSQHHRQIHTPSPDFRSFTNDLIHRPKYEQGAFASPALEAGDAVATDLLEKRVMAEGALDGIELEIRCRRGSKDESVDTDSSHSTIDAVMGGLAR